MLTCRVLVDLGCGEGNLELLLNKREIFSKIHSYDLVPLKNHVKIADVSNLPLDAESVDVTVFCLSLMGVNYIDFLIEASRIMKEEGLMVISEVTSRFASLSVFHDMMMALGLKKIYFVSFDFRFVRLLILRNNSELTSTSLFIRRLKTSTLIVWTHYSQRTLRLLSLRRKRASLMKSLLL